MRQIQSIPHASRLAGVRRALLAALAAVTLALPMAIGGDVQPSEAKSSKWVSQCATRIVAACKSGYHHVCVRRDSRGCCVQSRCHIN